MEQLLLVLEQLNIGVNMNLLNAKSAGHVDSGILSFMYIDNGCSFAIYGAEKRNAL
ncbi:hypothetical protein GT12_004682 [Salmonella enterica subsp. enterica]|nr:hypothetical protein [Salmonella enterica subsp. enterica]EHF6042515.1 hypothetical protein [Salmonella enterica]ELC5004978.1 hypothetical protein [Salmonella enterica]